MAPEDYFNKVLIMREIEKCIDYKKCEIAVLSSDEGEHETYYEKVKKDIKTDKKRRRNSPVVRGKQPQQLQPTPPQMQQPKQLDKRPIKKRRDRSFNEK